MNKSLRVAGALCCLVAVLVMNGGHWAVLQTFAWGKMFVAFSHQNSVGMALAKTFDGHHPCALCVTVRAGLQHQQHQEKEKAPLTTPERLLEPLWEFRQTTAPAPQTLTFEEQPVIPHLVSNFIDSPPSPPPRAETNLAA